MALTGPDFWSPELGGVMPTGIGPGCFYCEAMFAPSEIVDWVDGPQLETGSTTDGVTALCPRCGIDAVLPSAAPISVTAEVLAAMHCHWFEK